MKTNRILLALMLAAVILLTAIPELHAQEAPGNTANTANTFLERFTSRTANWWAILQEDANGLFKFAVTLEVALFGIRMILQQSRLDEIAGQFVNLLLYAGFIFIVIEHYQEWAETIAITGLKPLGRELTGSDVNPGTPVAVIMALGEKIFEMLADVGFWNASIMMLYLIITLIFLVIVFTFISALYIITLCEFHIIANIGILLIGLGGSRIFKDYAINVMRYILSVALKLFILEIIMNIGFKILNVESIQNENFAVKGNEILFIMVQSILLLALAKSLPETFAGLLNGATANSGNPLMSVGAGAAKMTVRAAGAATGIGAVAGAAKGAYDLARASGAKGFTGIAKGMGQAVLGARQAAQTAGLDKKSNSTISQLRSQANQVKAQQALWRSGGNTAAPASPASAGSQAVATASLPAAPMAGDGGGSGPVTAAPSLTPAPSPPSSVQAASADPVPAFTAADPVPAFTAADPVPVFTAADPAPTPIPTPVTATGVPIKRVPQGRPKTIDMRKFQPENNKS